MVAGAMFLVLPAGYRPAADRMFVSTQGNNTIAVIAVRAATGSVELLAAITSNSYLSLDPVGFTPREESVGGSAHVQCGHRWPPAPEIHPLSPR